MEDYLGYDGTIAFRSVGHSTDALSMLDKYLIGILPRNERLYVNRLRWWNTKFLNIFAKETWLHINIVKHFELLYAFLLVLKISLFVLLK